MRWRFELCVLSQDDADRIVLVTSVCFSVAPALAIKHSQPDHFPWCES